MLDGENPALKIAAPVIIVQGSADTTVFPVFTNQLHSELVAKGDHVQYDVVAGRGPRERRRARRRNVHELADPAIPVAGLTGLMVAIAPSGPPTYETATRSTTNTSAAFAGIVGGLPVFP